MKLTMKQYVDSRFKIIEDELISNNKSLRLLDNSIEISRSADQQNKTERKIEAKNILTDPNNRYISDAQLEELKNKVSKFDLDTAIEGVENNTKIMINRFMDNILNSKNIMNSIASLLNLSQNNESVENILTALSNYNISKYDDHIESSVHLTSEDREAINQLLKFIKIGCADWNAVEGEANYIRNKPEAFKADGGNSDTVGGYTAGDLMNKQLDNYIIGIDTADTYDRTDVNLFIDSTILSNNFSIFDEGTAICFREGHYDYNGEESINIVRCDVHGVSKGTIFKYNKDIILTDSYIYNLKIQDSNIIINEDCNLENVEFTNCTIIFKMNRCNITKCKFINCKLENSSCYNSIISNNILKDSGSRIPCLGCNNITKDNVFI